MDIIDENIDEIRLDEAAKILGRTSRTVRRHIEQGKLSARYVTTQSGRELRISRQDIEKLLQETSGHVTRNGSSGNNGTVTQQDIRQTPEFTGLTLQDMSQSMDLLTSQLEESKQREDRLWQQNGDLEQAKRNAEQKWWEQFEYNKNLLAERKQLTEGHQTLRDQFSTKEHELRQQLSEQHEQAENALQSVIKRKNLVIRLMGWALLLVLCSGGLFGLHMAGYVEFKVPNVRQGSMMSGGPNDAATD